MYARSLEPSENVACRVLRAKRNRKNRSRHRRRVAGAGHRHFRDTAKQVIDQAIGDNKLNEYLLYGFASVLVFCGVAVLVVGAYRGEGLVALAGSISSGLFFPAMNEARKICRENIAIRLLERPLSMAETSHEAADALKEFFLDTFISRRANP